jgi:hypothetical protein
MEHTTNKMDCSFIRNNLFSYQERLLSDKENKEFTDHLQSCEECSKIVSDFHSVLSFIDEKKADEPNPYSSTRILQRIESQIEIVKNKPNPFFQRILQPIALSFFLLIAIFIGFSIVKQKATRYSESTIHQKDIQVMKSGLNIPDFIDENNTFFDNH